MKAFRELTLGCVNQDLARDIRNGRGKFSFGRQKDNIIICLLWYTHFEVVRLAEILRPRQQPNPILYMVYISPKAYDDSTSDSRY